MPTNTPKAVIGLFGVAYHLCTIRSFFHFLVLPDKHEPTAAQNAGMIYLAGVF